MILVSLAPLLLVMDIPIENAPEPTDSERVAGEELFVYQLDGVLESQIDELIALDPDIDAEEFRSDHYKWKLERDLKCAEVGRVEPGERKEVECLSIMSEEYYQKLEVRIAELEEGKLVP